MVVAFAFFATVFVFFLIVALFLTVAPAAGVPGSVATVGATSRGSVLVTPVSRVASELPTTMVSSTSALSSRLVCGKSPTESTRVARYPSISDPVMITRRATSFDFSVKRNTHRRIVDTVPQPSFWASGCHRVAKSESTAVLDA